MSRLGLRSIPIPDGVTVDVGERTVTVRGPQGVVSIMRQRSIDVRVEGSAVVVAPVAGSVGARGISAQWGTQWALVRNAIRGVAQGWNRQLELQGVGYRAELAGKSLRLAVGFTHPVDLPIPDDLAVAVEKNVVTVRGVDRQRVGAFAAAVRSVRPPEPYKGKGIRYAGEIVRRKVGKVVGTTTA